MLFSTGLFFGQAVGAGMGSVSIKTQRRSQRAFSLVELLVVLGILAVTLSIMLPMINEARMIAARQTCASKMRNLAQGVLFHEGYHGRLPVAGVVEAREGQSFRRAGYDQASGNQFSWIVLILPLINEGAVHDEFDFSQNVAFQRRDPQARSLTALLCPNDDAGERSHVSARFGGREFGLGNFAAFISPVHGEQQQHWAGALGGFEPGSLDGQPLKRVRDGLNHTLLISEVRTSPLSTRDPRGAWAVPWIGSTTLAADVHPDLSGDEDLTNITNIAYQPDAGFPAAFTQLPNSQTGTADQISPCSSPVGTAFEGMPCGNYRGYGRGFTSASPRSNHRGGVNVTYLDGHVEFLGNDVDATTYARLISVDDGK